jgi:hypothetical protein
MENQKGFIYNWGGRICCHYCDRQGVGFPKYQAWKPNSRKHEKLPIESKLNVRIAISLSLWVSPRSERPVFTVNLDSYLPEAIILNLFDKAIGGAENAVPWASLASIYYG